MLLKIKTNIRASGKDTMNATHSIINNTILGSNNIYHGNRDKGYSVSPINQYGEILVNVNDSDKHLISQFLKHENVEQVDVRDNLSEEVIIEAKLVNYKKDHVSNNIFSFASYMKNDKNVSIEILNFTDTKVHYKNNILKVSNMLLKVEGGVEDIKKLLYSGIGVGTGHGFGFCKIIKK